MHNTQITISYDGTRYGGWQIQINAKTIQGEIEKAVKKIIREKITLYGAGRTDSGVHAKAQVANFKVKKLIPLNNLQAALNSNLPKDISIIKIKKVSPNFHARFHAKSKFYRYAILNDRLDNPFLRPYYHKVVHTLDLSRMRKEAACLVGKHDFKSFQAKSNTSAIKNTTRTIKKIKIRKIKRFIHIDIEANGFLHNMVRNIVGTLVEVGRGFKPEGSMKEMLQYRDRSKAGPTAPAKGLMLMKVLY